MTRVSDRHSRLTSPFSTLPAPRSKARAGAGRGLASAAIAVLLGLTTPGDAVAQRLVKADHGFGPGAVYNGRLIYSGYDATYGEEPWITDGTAAGTTMLADLSLDWRSSYSHGFVEANGKLFFTAWTQPSGRELYVTDGTTAGTVMVKEISPGQGGSADNLTAFAGRLFFTAWGPGGVELWTSDGTTAGTAEFMDINPSGHANPSSLTVVDDLLLFAADDGTSGKELWATDGTVAGTSLVADIMPGAGGSDPRDFAVRDGELVFSADDGQRGRELWTWAQVGAFSRLGVIDINPGPAGSWPHFMKTSQDRVYFAANDGATGAEPWVTDGTVAGTAMLGDLAPGTQGSGPGTFTPYGTGVAFVADNGADGDEPWATDGTAAGTRMLRDIHPSGSSMTDRRGRGAKLYAFDGHCIFRADDGTSGREPWLSDGSTSGTRMLKDLNPQGESSPSDFVALGDTLLFGANDATGSGIWALDRSEIARCTSRNGSGINPSGYSCATLPIVGGTWRSDVVVSSATAGTLLGVALRPSAAPLGTGELLIELAPTTAFVIGPGAYAIPVPADNGLVGATLATQAFRVDATSAGLQLVPQNALDLRLGR
ncbi:MAG: ELWxxDGT repeat protein [Planctomycetota bacterium]